MHRYPIVKGLVYVLVILMSSMTGVCQEFTPKKIFEISKEKMAEVTDIVANMSREIGGTGVNTTSEGKIFIKKGYNKIRFEGKIVIMGVMYYDSLIIMDGTDMWNVMITPKWMKQDGKRQNCTKMPIKKIRPAGTIALETMFGEGATDDPLEDTKAMADYFDLNYLGKDGLDSEEVHVIVGIVEKEFTDRKAMVGISKQSGYMVPATIKIQISVNTGFPLRVEVRSKSGEYIVIYYKNVQFNTCLKDELFTYTPTADVEVMDMKKLMQEMKLRLCMAKMKHLGDALKEYAWDHDGKYPESLSTLPVGYCQQLEYFMCPAREEVEKSEVSNDFSICYEYVQGVTNKFPSECIIVYDRQENHEGGRNVCFADCHVQWVTTEEWPLIWQKHTEALKNNRNK